MYIYSLFRSYLLLFLLVPSLLIFEKKIKLFSNHKNRKFSLSSGHVQIIMNNLLAVILESKY